MKKLIFCFFFSCCFFFSFSDQLSYTADKETVSQHLDSLNLVSSFDFQNNEVVMDKINNYLFKEKKLLTRMLSLSKYYFPIFEIFLDKYNLPLELKYLAVVESSLNARAQSQSGARGLWQFMYSTGTVSYTHLTLPTKA